MNKNNTNKKIYEKIKRNNFVFGLCLIISLFASCGGDDNSPVEVPDVAVKGVSLSSNSLKIEKGTTNELRALITPTNATNKNVIWVSSNSSVATISNTGLITAVSPGTTIISVVTMDGQYKAECNVTVLSKVQSITLDKTELTIVEGGEETLVAAILPEDASNKNVIWKSADESIAKVSSTGVVTALKIGKTTVTATSEDGHFNATCAINVESGTNINYKPYGDKQNW